ncbi:MAG: leucine-rich repeat protein [Muribaculaceae bacterium]|nr:leucine-rich repeat protein [Muribaculaceae bacterium]MBP3288626.1 leucine-rich repeat protein [Muribaculaceae bacterium]
MKPIVQRIWMVMAMLFLSISASAYDFEVDGIAYNILSATSLNCEVACVIDPTQTYVTIPETVEYRNREFKVVQIGAGSFLNSQVEAISLPESIITIESSAFEGSKINVIELPKQLTNIKDRAFFNSNIKTLRLDFTSQCEIGRNAFSDCDSLRTVCVGENVLLHKHNFNSDGDRMYGVFKRNANLLKVDIEGTVKVLPAYTFHDCHSLQSINILGTVDDLEGCAWTEALDTLNVAGHVNNLGTSPYGHNDATIPCRTLRIMGSVTNCNGPFTNSLTYADLNGEIGYLGGFIGCSMIEEVIMPNTITSIEGFKNCTSLKSVVLSESISSLEDRMFEGCISLRDLTIPPNVRIVKTGWPWSATGDMGSGDLVVWELTSLTISQNSENNLISFASRGTDTGCRLRELL